MRRLALVTFAVLVLAFSTAAQTPCPFGSSKVDELALCLIRPVKIYGNLGAAPAALPAPLDSLIGKPVEVKADRLRAYLATNNISQASIGGLLSTPLTTARYFVIHDTSSPYLRDAEFPTNIDDATWVGNNLRRWEQVKVTHVYVNRLGESATASNFERTVVGTKYEKRNPKRKGLFVHVELIEPRRRDPDGGANNDALAPVPGFTAPQLDRLALLYVAASVRRGQWLLPAFHAAVDAGIRDAHDDPQNFDLDGWLAALQALLTELREPPGPDGPRPHNNPTQPRFRYQLAAFRRRQSLPTVSLRTMPVLPSVAGIWLGTRAGEPSTGAFTPPGRGPGSGGMETTSFREKASKNYLTRGL